ncbi:hypothetical protein CON11_19625 [Priestia megaterium]|nr:hypothetical protein CON11_19625 [Priestia megaterium]
MTANGLLVAAVMAACNELNGLEGVPSPGPGALESAQMIDSSPQMKLLAPVAPVMPVAPVTPVTPVAPVAPVAPVFGVSKRATSSTNILAVPA